MRCLGRTHNATMNLFTACGLQKYRLRDEKFYYQVVKVCETHRKEHNRAAQCLAWISHFFFSVLLTFFLWKWTNSTLFFPFFFIIVIIIMKSAFSRFNIIFISLKPKYKMRKKKQSEKRRKKGGLNAETTDTQAQEKL